MNTYEIKGCKGDIRRNVTICIAVISLLVGWLLYGAFIKLDVVIAPHIPEIACFFSKWEFLGVLPTQFTAAVAYGLMRWLFNKCIWKWPCINKHLGVPDLNGVWEGGLISSVIKDGKYVELKMRLTIKQTWEEMTCSSGFQASNSNSDIVCIDSSDSRGTVLKFTYVNRSEDLALEMQQFVGYNELVLKDANTLSGYYYTNRKTMTRGSIFLTRMSPTDEINESVKVNIS